MRRFRVEILPRRTTGRRSLGRFVKRSGKLSVHAVRTLHVLGEDVSTHRHAVCMGLGMHLCVGRVPRSRRFAHAVCGGMSKGPRIVIIKTKPNKLFTTLQLVRLKLQPIMIRQNGGMHSEGVSVTHVDHRRGITPRDGCDFKRKKTKTCSSNGLCAQDGGQKGIGGVLGMFYRRNTDASVLTSTRPRVNASGLPHIVRGVQGAVVRYNNRIRFRAQVSSLVVRGGGVANVRAGAKGAFGKPIVLTAKRSTQSICQ